jgi:peptidoglycan/LPS O-acetylase OafA/YrhL
LAGLERLEISVVTASIAALAIVFSGSPGSPQIALVGLLTAATVKLGRRAELRNFLGKTLLFLGTISYSLYLTHVPIGGRVVNLGGRIVEGKLEQFFLSILALVTSIAFAWIFYHVIERRSLQMSRHLFRKPQLSEVAAE